MRIDTRGPIKELLSQSSLSPRCTTRRLHQYDRIGGRLFVCLEGSAAPGHSLNSPGSANLRLGAMPQAWQGEGFCLEPKWLTTIPSLKIPAWATSTIVCTSCSTVHHCAVYRRGVGGTARRTSLRCAYDTHYGWASAPGQCPSPLSSISRGRPLTHAAGCFNLVRSSTAIST